MSLKKVLQEECKVPPNPEKINETIKIASMAMKYSKKGKSRSYRYFIILQIKQAMPAIWIIQTLIVLALVVLWPLFITTHYSVANDPRFIALFIGCFSIYIAMSGVYMMIRSFRYHMNEIEMSTMISTRRQLFTKLMILGISDIIIFGIVIVIVKALSQMRVAMIVGCIMTPFLLANCIGLTVELYAPSDSYHMRIMTFGIVLSFALLLTYSFVPSIINLFSSHAGGTICAALFLFCVNRIGKLSAKLSSMNLVTEID